MPHCPILHKISLYAKFDLIILHLVVEGVSRIAARSSILSLWLIYWLLTVWILWQSWARFCFFVCLFFLLLQASLIILHIIHTPFSESLQLCFLSTSLTSFPCPWFLFNNGCHLYVIYDIATVQGLVFHELTAYLSIFFRI